LESKDPQDGLSWYQRATGRMLVSGGTGLLAALAAPGGLWVRGLVGWNVGSTLALLLHFWILSTSDANQTCHRAGSSDPGSKAVWMLDLVACLFSLAASLVMIGERHQLDHPHLLVALCLWAVISAWLLTHTAFTLRYAHLYYRGEEIGGLGFPGDQPPDDLDFAYFAFTLGMCFQVSDVTIQDRQIRRTALLHAVLSFFYNTAILALALNLIFGHIGNLN
jgi:uncharacterized membrane protein